MVIIKYLNEISVCISFHQAIDIYGIGDLPVIDAQVRVTHEDDADEDDDDDEQVLKSVGCDSLLIRGALYKSV